MEERFRQSIRDRLAEFDTLTIPRATRRDVRLLGMPGKADVVIGMRRVGKSWLLLHRIQELLDAGVPRSRILYCEFEDERIAGLRAEHLHQLDDQFFAHNPGSRDQECWFFFDEIQEVPGWEKYARRLLGNHSLHLTVTGSSARLLSTEIATSMRGRAMTTELFPFSFAEALAHVGIDRPDKWPVAGAARSQLQSAFERYLTTGGFPEVQALDPEFRRRTLQGYLEIALLRDVAERHAIGNVTALRFLVRRVLRSIGSRISANALLKDFQSQGIAIAKSQVYAQLEHIEDAFLAFLLPLHTNSERRRMTNLRKAYAIDHGLVRACTPGTSADAGHHLENLVYLELRRRGHVLGYHLTDDGHEVDFVAESHGGARSLVQACADLGSPPTRARELDALAAAVAETGIRDAVVVSLAEEHALVHADVPIRIVPAWRWLLECT
ncbi:MAG: ATP-binding protein [Planctomycetota bacterium]